MLVRYIEYGECVDARKGYEYHVGYDIADEVSLLTLRNLEE